MARATNLMIGTLALALIAGAFGARLGYQKYAGIKQQVPFRVVFEGSASGVRRGSSVNFAGVRIGEVVSLKLDHHRVIAMTRIDGNAPIRKDTQVGLEFQGLTGIAAISFTGGTEDAPPPPTGPDGIPELTADPEGTMGVQQKIRIALRNVDKAIADNEDARSRIRCAISKPSPLRCPAMASGSTASSPPPIPASMPSTAALAKTETFLKGLGSDKYGGELLPTIDLAARIDPEF